MLKNIDKNLLLGILLIAIMVGGYMWYFNNHIKEIETSPSTNSSSLKDSTSIISHSSKLISDTNKSKITDTLVGTTTKAEVYTLENELIKFDINSKGATIGNVVLKKYTTNKDKNIILLKSDQTKIDMKLGSESSNVLNFELIKKDSKSIELKSNKAIVKIELNPESYLISQTWTTTNATNAELLMETVMPVNEANISRERLYSTIMYLPTNESYVSKLDPSTNKTENIENSYNYISLTDQFFNITVVPNSPFLKGNASTYYMENDSFYNKKYTTSNQLSPSKSILLNYYVGPSSYQLMKKEKNDIYKIIPLSQDFILFRWVKIFNEYFIIPLFDFLAKFFSNYGIIIFLLTLIIKIILMPLSYKTFKSGVAMKILKPDIEKLKKKHGDDQTAFAQEQMKMYNEAGASPFGGCFPMLLQMPILFAMFSFFPAAIELRHKPFLWATDLSTFDSILNLPFNIPFYGNHVSLFALLMTITQIATSIYTQRLQPSSPQADQMKIMTYTMPVVFLFMFNSFPAALTYYYLLQNVLSILQQWFVTKFFIDEDKLRKEIEENRKKPKKQSSFQKKMSDIMQQAEEQKKLQKKN